MQRQVKRKGGNLQITTYSGKHRRVEKRQAKKQQQQIIPQIPHLPDEILEKIFLFMLGTLKEETQRKAMSSMMEYTMGISVIARIDYKWRWWSYNTIKKTRRDPVYRSIHWEENCKDIWCWNCLRPITDNWQGSTWAWGYDSRMFGRFFFRGNKKRRTNEKAKPSTWSNKSGAMFTTWKPTCSVSVQESQSRVHRSLWMQRRM